MDLADMELAVYLAAGCSLDEKPGKNWVQDEGGLPGYICQIARAIKRDGKSTSSAIAIAVSRVKKWATGAGVDAKTQAKAAKAVAQWELMKKRAKADNAVRATRQDGSVYIMLTSGSFDTRAVQRKWEALERDRRNARRAEMGENYAYDSVPYSYIKELWSDYIIVETEALAGHDGPSLFKVPYSVSGVDDVEFDEPIAVKVEYVEDMDPLSKSELDLIKDLLEPATALSNIMDLSERLQKE